MILLSEMLSERVRRPAGARLGIAESKSGHSIRIPLPSGTRRPGFFAAVAALQRSEDWAAPPLRMAD